MKNNSKSELCIKQVITFVITLIIIMSANTQLFISENTQVESTNIKNENNVKEEIKINEREIQVTSRSAEERTLESINKEIKEEYILISEIQISKNMDLSKKVGISKKDFNILMSNLKSDSTGFFKSNSDVIYNLCEKYEINEIFFSALIVAESGWNIADSHRNAHNYISMLSNGKLIKYSSDEEGLEVAAKLLHNQYLSESGSFYNGKTLYDIQKVFCPNSKTWVNLVYNCMEQIID